MPFSILQKHSFVQNDTEGPSTSTNTNISCSKPPEELLHAVIGNGGRWFVVITLILNTFMLFYGLNVFASELLFPQHLKFYCNDTKILNHCRLENGSNCNAFIYTQEYGYSITEKVCSFSVFIIIKVVEYCFNVKHFWMLTLIKEVFQFTLVCERMGEILTENVFFMCGLAIGFISMGFWNDSYGRKTVLFYNLVHQSVMGVFITCSSAFQFFTAVTFFYAISIGGTTVSAIVLGCELTSNKWRTLILGSFYVSSALGLLLLPFIWMIFLDSKKCIVVLSLPQLLLLLFIGVTKESPSWLLNNNNFIKTRSILLTVARFNKLPLPTTLRIHPIDIIRRANENGKAIYVWNILKPTITRWTILALLMTWILISFIWRLIAKHILAENKDTLKILCLMGLSNLFGASFGLGLSYLLKYRVVIGFSSIFGCCFSVLANILRHKSQYTVSESLILYLHLTSLAFYSASLFTLWVITPRLFPTEIRGQGTGTVFGVGHFFFLAGQLLSPRIFASLPVFLSTICTFTAIVTVCCTFLFSVHKRELPECLKDSIQFKKCYKPIRWSGVRPTLEESEIKIWDYDRADSSVSS